ncbi:MAG: BolA family transcriptional regulator [Archangium gephyra]|uniref:BolA family transcriptional regulator n=1 Tax=Archangium gephyra TaxID=48 RepID=A0A2W5SP59_9BACT|nr:MAG: BolA family transcriptional regulator [Archangium gephyra]
MALTTDWIAARIKTAIPDADIEIDDTTGTGDHFEARIVSATFAGVPMVRQHQAVYAPLKDVLATGELHALALKTYSPEQWAKAKG